MRTVADRLSAALEKEGRTIRSLQQELHHKAVPGSSYANVHGYFKGKTPPTIEFVTAAAEALGVRPAWLAFEDGEMTPELQAAKYEWHQTEPPDTPEVQLAEEVYKAITRATEGLVAPGELIYHVLFDFYYDALNAREDVVTDADGIQALLVQRFPRTLRVGLYADPLSSHAILFSEAAAAYAADLLARPSASFPEAAGRLDEWRSTPSDAGQE